MASNHRLVGFNLRALPNAMHRLSYPYINWSRIVESNHVQCIRITQHILWILPTPVREIRLKFTIGATPRIRTKDSSGFNQASYH